MATNGRTVTVFGGTGFLGRRRRSSVLRPAVSLVSFDVAGCRGHPAGDADPLA